MNYPGHIGMGVLGFGVTSNIINLNDTHNSIAITIFLGITMFSASKIIDQDMKFAYFLPKDMRHKRYLYHRQITHSLILWIGLLFYSLFGIPNNLMDIQTLSLNINYYLFFFAIGGLTHLFADMLTGSIPIFLWGKYSRGFRIGLNFSDSFKKTMVLFGDKSYVLMMIIGIWLVFTDFKLISIF